MVEGVLGDSWMVVRAEGGKDVEGVWSKVGGSQAKVVDPREECRAIDVVTIGWQTRVVCR